MNTNTETKTIFSAIQPSGIITLGNYLGAIKNWLALQNEYNCIYAIADLHALSAYPPAAELRANTLQLLALYLACGLDCEKSVLFLQSHVPAHAELTWILNTFTYPGELSRMTQFKDKSKKKAENVNMGLMDYPVLMASDILLYQADLVPVGHDQKQHIELTRDLAIRFNNKFSPTFKVPEGFIPKYGAKVMSLTEPDKKMSKSDENPNSFISMTDDDDTIIRKFKKAVTDSGDKIIYSKEKPGINNLLNIYCALKGISVKQAEGEFENCSYASFKQAVGDAAVETIKPIREKSKKLLADKAYLNNILKTGAEKAERIARRTLSKVYRKIGLYQTE